MRDALAVWAGVIFLLPLACGGEDRPPKSPPAAQRHRTSQDKFDREVKELQRDLGRVRSAEGADTENERANGSQEKVGLKRIALLADKVEAEVGATIGPPAGPVVFVGSLDSGPAWSTIKVPIALRVLEDAGGPSGLSVDEHDLIASALTTSDNEAAAELFDQLTSTHGGVAGAARAVTEVLRKGGDDRTEVSTIGRNGFSPYGQTAWALRDQHRFLSGLISGCVAPPESQEYVLDLMARVRSDTWGLGSAGMPALWKGGWGPGTDGRYLLRQMGALEVDGGRVVVTLAVISRDGDFAEGQDVASAVARELAEQAPSFATEPTPC